MGRGRGASAGRGATPAWMARALESWFPRNARELPWREVDPGTQQRNPYRSLVSEVMLQQTQVSRVIEKFGGFVRAFPDARALAGASERAVLAAWSGLGYYRRARLLHEAARQIVELHGGHVPSEVDALRRLPGVGRYTAGAVASICFGRRAPIVDGNVARVLLRVHGLDLARDDRAGEAWCWGQAELVAKASEDPGVANEALMELGATVCTPGAPTCGACPLRERCVARREGRQGEIPRAKKAARVREVFVATLVLTRRDGAVLLERRGDRGMWAGMWETPTLERTDREATCDELGAFAGRSAALERVGSFVHRTTHRMLRFGVWRAGGAGRATGGRRWVAPARLGEYPVSNATRRVLAMASRVDERRARAPRGG